MKEAEWVMPKEFLIHAVVKQRAYELWEKNGSPFGNADLYWVQAERELSQGFLPIATGFFNVEEVELE